MNSMVSVLPAATYCLRLYSLIPTPWSISMEVTISLTLSPLFTVIVSGSKLKDLAVISNVFIVSI